MPTKNISHQASNKESMAVKKKNKMRRISK